MTGESGSPSLFDALRSGDNAGVHRLLTEFPHVARQRSDDGISAVLWAMYVGEPVLAEHVARAAGSLDIFEATVLGDTATVSRLLAQDDDAVRSWTPDGFTALHLAAFFGQPAVAQQLISAGARIDVASANTMRVAPLHSAAAGRRPQVVAVLLAAGADPRATQEGGYTPLHSAAMNGDRESTLALVAAGADPHQPADDGRTPAQVATGSVAGVLQNRS